MDIKTKVKYAEQAIRVITTHDDADMALREAALKKLEALIASEREAMQKRVDEKAASL